MSAVADQLRMSPRSDSTRPPTGQRWDLLVIGGGTAGIVAARTAAGLGANVLLVEQDRTGGDCLWTGCVPSKTLLAIARRAATARPSSQNGVDLGPVRVDFARVMARVRAAIEQIEPEDSADTLRAAGVRVVFGSARLTGSDRAEIQSAGPPAEVRFRDALIATGAAPVAPPIPGLDDAPVLTSDTVWRLGELPDRLLVLGGGSVGCELGQAFARLGSSVSVVEAAEQLLPGEAADAAELIRSALQADGVRVHTGTTVTKVHRQSSAWSASVGDGSRLEFDQLLIATGRCPRTDSLGLADAGVDLDEHGFVQVDARLRTSNPRVWAAGDVTSHPGLTHVAGVNGSLAASNAVLGLRRRADTATVPRVTFTAPEVASFGVSPDSATDGLHVRTTPHRDVNRAVTDGQPDGFTSLVLDRRDRIVGATIVGPRAGESLAEVVLAARHGLRARDLAGSMHAYPTYSDGIWQAGITQVQQSLSRPAVRRVTRLLLAARRLR